MKTQTCLIAIAMALSACKGEVSSPMSSPKFTAPPRTLANTWVAEREEQNLIDNFLKRFPADQAARYREILLRSDAYLELPKDPASQHLLDAIYKQRVKAAAIAAEKDRKAR
jgi:hypothetical protein